MARVASSETVCAADSRAQVNASDIAGVRDSRNEDAVSRVALVSSSTIQGAADEARKLQSAILGSNLTDGKEEEESDEESAQLKLPRAQDPCSKFNDNGLRIMNLSRSTFPLIRWDLESKTYSHLKQKDH